MAEPPKQQMGDGQDNVGQAASQAAKAAKQAAKQAAAKAAAKGAEATTKAAAATVKAGETASLTFKNDIINAKIKIKKIDALTKTPLEGVKRRKNSHRFSSFILFTARDMTLKLLVRTVSTPSERSSSVSEASSDQKTLHLMPFSCAFSIISRL